jgi:hypothetical protein
MTEEKKERARKREIQAKKWEEEVHQHLVAWGRSILVKCVDVALHIWPPQHEQFKPWARSILLKCIDISMHVWPPPAGLMYLFVKHKDKPGLRSFRRGPTTIIGNSATEPHLEGFAGIGGQQSRSHTSGTASRRRLWNTQQTQLENDIPAAEASESAESTEATAEISSDDAAQDAADEVPVEHDPCDSDFAPHGDKHNLEGYKVLSKRDASGTVKWLLKEKNGQIHESENMQDKVQEREDNCQIEVENAMDRDAITEEDRKFIASESDDDEGGGDENNIDKYPEDEGGADSPIRQPKNGKKKKKKRRVHQPTEKRKTKFIDASEPAKRKRKPKLSPPPDIPLIPPASSSAAASGDRPPPLVHNEAKVGFLMHESDSEVAEMLPPPATAAESMKSTEVDEADYDDVADLLPNPSKRPECRNNNRDNNRNNSRDSSRNNSSRNDSVGGFPASAPPPIRLPRLPPPPTKRHNIPQPQPPRTPPQPSIFPTRKPHRLKKLSDE